MITILDNDYRIDCTFRGVITRLYSRDMVIDIHDASGNRVSFDYDTAEKIRDELDEALAFNGTKVDFTKK